MSNNTLSAACINAELLANSFVYKIILFVKGSANLSAVYFFIFHFCSKGRVKIYHPNTKIIYWFICLFAFLMSLHYCFLYIYEFGRLMPFMSDPCSRTWWTPLLFYIRVANVTFMNGQNASLIVLCIERTICILRIQNYENSSKPIPVAICLLILTGIASFGYVVLYLPGVNFSIPLAISTTRNAVNAYNYQISLIFLIFVEIAGVLFFLFLHNWGLWYRKKIRGFKFYEQRQNILMVSNNQPLFVKFQIEKTVQMTSIFLPIIIAKCSMTVFSASAAIFSNLIWTNTKTDVQMVIYELVNVTYIQCLPTSILLLLGSGQLKRALGFPIKKVNKVEVVVHENSEQDEHFQRLKMMFEK